MKMSIETFPKELLLLVLEYAVYADQMRFSSCCSEWYNHYFKRYFRKLEIDRRSRDEKFLQKLIVNQLNLTLNRFSDVEKITSFLEDYDFTVHQLRCDGQQFVDIMKAIPYLKVNNLSIEVAFSHRNLRLILEQISNNLLKVQDCVTLFTRYPIAIPFLPSLENLVICGFTFSDQNPLLPAYFTTLHHLNIYDSKVTDVSPFGSIPSLELMFCHELVDISSLNNNESVIVCHCKKIKDFSGSFANSRLIEIRLQHGGNYLFDLSRWQKVENSSLIESYEEKFIYGKYDNQLPKTVRKCKLGGKFVSKVNFTGTPDHVLNELKLNEDQIITSLEGYGLERVAIIDCDELTALQTLQGLGRGRNRKVSIYHCHKVTDFSPLNHIPIVTIEYCHGFTDPLQVRFVRDLRLEPMEEICFISNHIPHNPYHNIHALTFSCFQAITNFDGLELIPSVELKLVNYHLIGKFLEEGKQLQNQRIVLSYQRMDFEPLSRFICDINTRFLAEQYYSDTNISSQLVWTRKEL